MKEKKKMHDSEKQAKLSVVKHMRDMASDMMKDKLGGLKKVSVASNDPRGLQMGLDKAKELVSGGAYSEPSYGSEEGDSQESTESPHSDREPSGEYSEEECTPEEIDAEIARLQALKEKMTTGG